MEKEDFEGREKSETRSPYNRYNDVELAPEYKIIMTV